MSSLKNDSGFVTDKVNIESYQKYIKFIENHFQCQSNLNHIESDEQPKLNNTNEQIVDIGNTTKSKELNEELKKI